MATQRPDMTNWEYDTIDLNILGRNQTEMDVLNAAGAQGWELVAINACNVAILKRPVPAANTRAAAPPKAK